MCVSRVKSTFMCRTAKDDGIYRSVMNHRLFTTFHKVLWDTQLAIYNIVSVAARSAVCVGVCINSQKPPGGTVVVVKSFVCKNV